MPMIILKPCCLRKISGPALIDSMKTVAAKTVAIKLTGSRQKRNSPRPIWNLASRRSPRILQFNHIHVCARLEEAAIGLLPAVFTYRLLRLKSESSDQKLDSKIVKGAPFAKYISASHVQPQAEGPPKTPPPLRQDRARHSRYPYADSRLCFQKYQK